MSFQFISSTRNQRSSGSSTTLVCSTGLNIQKGDMLVAIVNHWTGDKTTTISDSGSNSFTMIHNDPYDSSLYTHYGYILNAQANSSATITVTFGASIQYCAAIVFQFRPSVGVVTLNTYDVTATGTSLTVESNSVNIIDGDCLAIGGYGKYYFPDISALNSQKLGDLDATAPNTDAYYAQLWYLAFSNNPTLSATAKCTLPTGLSYNDWNCAGILVFLITPSIPIIMNHLKNQGVL